MEMRRNRIWRMYRIVFLPELVNQSMIHVSAKLEMLIEHVRCVLSGVL
jgi:hypothetical protein